MLLLPQKKIFILLVIYILFHTECKACDTLSKQVHILKHIEKIETHILINTIKNDLLSNDLLVQEAGCIILSKILVKLKKGDHNAQFMFNQFASDKKTIISAADIIESRLPGWYALGERTKNKGSDIHMYTPLFYLLGTTHFKIARGTLLRSLIYLNDCKHIFENIPLTEEMISLSLKRLKIIEKKMCCVYPGKDPIITILENNSRSSMLSLFKGIILTNSISDKKIRTEIKLFILDCMQYGDCYNGHLIRIQAIKIAGLLIDQGEKEFIRTIEDLSKNDPYHIHAYDEKNGYSIINLKYPVREISSEILLRLTNR